MTGAAQSWLDAALEGPDLPGLGKARGAAAKAFAKEGLPHRRMEDWKYTDIRSRLGEALPPAEPLEAPGDFLNPFAALDAPEICFGNGFWAHGAELREGVDVLTLSEALSAKADWVAKSLGAAKAPEDQPMLALNTALMRDGLCLKVARGLDGGAVVLGHEGRAGRQTVRNLIVLEPGARFTLIEAHQGGGEAQQSQQVSEIFVGEGAQLTHIRLQDAGAKTVHLATDVVNVAGGGDYRGFVTTTGAALSRQETFIEFTGPDAEAHISGAYMLASDQHADVTTRIHHAVPRCTSREVFKGVIADEARGVFQGRVIVAEGAQKTDGHQLNKTLLLSDRAEIDTKPELEIYADDVKCSHGAATGQLDENQLFYMRARGIDEASARGLLMQSFLAEALEEVEDERLRACLQGHVNGWLGAHAEKPGGVPHEL